TEGEWVEHTLVASSPVPAPVEGPSVFDPQCWEGHLGVFGGLGMPHYQDETWTLRCPLDEFRGCTWEQVSLAASPPARAYATTTNTTNGVLLYGGTGEAGTLDDLWLLDACAETPTWTAVSATGTAPARWGHTMARRTDDAPTGVSRWVIFGGFSSHSDSSASNEAWMLVN